MTGLVQQATQSRLRSLRTALSPFCNQHKAGQGHYTQHSVHSAGNTMQAEVITHSTQSILQATQSRPGSLHTALSPFCRQHKAGQGHYTRHSVHSAGNTKQVRVITHGTQSILQATQSRPGSLHMALSPFCRQHKAGQGHYIWHSVHSAGNTKQARVITYGTQSIHGAQMACSIEDSPLLLCTAWEVILTQGDNTKYQINSHV